MSRTLAKIKLAEARSALRCAQSNLEAAAGELSEEPVLGIIGEGLTVSANALGDLMAALHVAIRDIEGPPIA